MQVGGGDFVYEFEEGWGCLPEEISLGWVAAVAVDSLDRVYVYSRSDNPVVVFDREGNFLCSWGQDLLQDAHGIYIEADDTIWCVERETHCVRKVTTDGMLLMTIGTPNQEGEREGEPFRLPTDIGFDAEGHIYVSDGYGNARVHKFSPTGELIYSWGEPGSGPGQFDLPHCVRVDRRGRVLVADRANNRIQIFDTSGNYVEEWGDLNHPDTIHIDADDIVYIAEMDQRISILSLDGELLARWGDGVRREAPGQFHGCPHGIWTDSRGDLYVSEVQTDGRFQKFVRRT